MKRISPAARVVLAVAAIALLFDVALVALPALADNGATASPSGALAALQSGPTTTPAGPTMPLYDPTDGPTPVPSPTPIPTPTPTPTPKPTPKPTPRDTVWNARIWLKAQIGATQYSCIDAIFTRESKWNPLAGSPMSAYGIPQAFPGSKMATFGSNWRYSPLTQVKWGLWYVNQRYGSACQAWAFWQAHGWY